MDNHDTEYTLLVGKKRILVTQEVYKAYYRCRDRENTWTSWRRKITSPWKAAPRKAFPWNT